jgi:site-specific DNA-methyltransferase (adenine-specific)
MMENFFKFHGRASDTRLVIGDCLDVLNDQPNTYDAIITDPPYELHFMGKEWDATGISFSPELWAKLFAVLKPGGFIASFAATRLYHRMAVVAEDAGFALYPFLIWKYPQGVPKPVNVSELFDRDNLDEREIIGYRTGSGYTQANVDHGMQNRTSTKFPEYARHVSAEAQEWRGYYYGVNCLMPCMEPIMLAQKPIDQKRAIDNLRMWRTGALNLGIPKERYDAWPNTVLEHAKAKKKDHESNHPSVKPVSLMEDLCLLVCPSGGHILDPFAGTGTTGVAAQNLGYDCTLIEKNSEMEPVINRRLGR